jgi:DNA-binding transcriptional ArsR family regulator
MKRAAEGTVLNPRQCATLLKVVADETRLRIVGSLLTEEKCVTDLVHELGCPQPHVSHHLRILRESGVVEGTRAGKRVCYRIVPIVGRALATRRGKALDFGCCELRFPDSMWATIKARRPNMVSY